MAKGVAYVLTCDPCNHDGMPDITGHATRVISIDGMPPVEVDLCGRDNRLVSWLREVCEQEGRPTAGKEERLARAADKVKEVTARRSKELGTAPPPKPAADAKKPKKRGNKNDPDKIWLFCTESHPSEGGGPRKIAYGDRNSHVSQCHEGKKMWDVKWDDPDGHLKYPCNAHAECRNTGLSFTSAQGLAQHIRGSALENINQP